MYNIEDGRQLNKVVKEHHFRPEIRQIWPLRSVSASKLTEQCFLNERFPQCFTAHLAYTAADALSAAGRRGTLQTMNDVGDGCVLWEHGVENHTPECTPCSDQVLKKPAASSNHKWSAI